MCAECGHIPTIWKTSTIIPIPKSKNARELSDFRPVPLTSLVVKIFEKVIKDMVASLIDGKLDPLQFAHQNGKGVDDAQLFILDRVFKHLGKSRLLLLTNRIQQALVNGRVSGTGLSRTGSPQGCVLSALLFIMDTDGCRTSQEGSYIVRTWAQFGRNR